MSAPVLAIAPARPDRRALRLLLALLLAVGLTGVHAPDADAARLRTDLEWRAEQVLLELHNAERARVGAPAMVEYRDVREVARGWADHMAATGRLEHNPNYTDQICCRRRLGENVAYRGLGTRLDEASVRAAATAMHEGYMSSSGHRRNILEPDYTQVGIGMALVQQGRSWYLWSTTNFRQADGTEPGPDIPRARDIADTCGTASAPSFHDVPDGNVHAPRIACIEDRGITAGKADGSYGPKEFLSRGQIATFLTRTLEAAGATPPAGEACPDGPHARGLSAMHAWGIFEDDCDDRSAVTRQQMATWSVRALQALGQSTPRVGADLFHDDNHLDGASQGAHNAIAAWGVVTGSGNDRFSPEALLRRDQMATFLARLLDAAIDGA